MSDDSGNRRSQRWDVTWTEVERAQLESMLRATPRQRLEWLENAMRLAHASGALGTRRESSDRAREPGRGRGRHAR